MCACYVHDKSLQSCLTATPWTVVLQAPLSMGILQARILEWVAVFSSRGSSQSGDQTCVSYVSCIGRWALPLAPPGKPDLHVYKSLSTTRGLLDNLHPTPRHHHTHTGTHTYIHLTRITICRNSRVGASKRKSGISLLLQCQDFCPQIH